MDQFKRQVLLKQYMALQLKLTRIMSGNTQKDLGLATGVSEKAVSAYETQQSLPSLIILLNLCAFLQVPVSHFFPDKPIQKKDIQELKDRIRLNS